MFSCVICGVQGTNNRLFLMAKTYKETISIIEGKLNKNIQDIGNMNYLMFSAAVQPTTQMIVSHIPIRPTCHKNI